MQEGLFLNRNAVHEHEESLGAFAILALLAAGVSYWVVSYWVIPRSGPSPTHVAEAPPSVQSSPAPEASPPVGQEKRTGELPAAQTSSPSTAPAAPTAPAGTASAGGQPTQAPASSNSQSTSEAAGQSREATSESPPPSTAMALAMPDEDKMSEANRRQVQEALHRLDFYDGPIDGIFGPLTRAAIHRFQDSVGEKGRSFNGRGGWPLGKCDRSRNRCERPGHRRSRNFGGSGRTPPAEASRPSAQRSPGRARKCACPRQSAGCAEQCACARWVQTGQREHGQHRRLRTNPEHLHGVLGGPGRAVRAARLYRAQHDLR
jgi:hypothetical protein